MAVPIAHGSGRAARRSRSSSGRPLNRAGFWVLMVTLFVLFVLAGSWLVDGVAQIGRGDNDCLHSARKACGVFVTW